MPRRRWLPAPFFRVLFGTYVFGATLIAADACVQLNPISERTNPGNLALWRVGASNSQSWSAVSHEEQAPEGEQDAVADTPGIRSLHAGQQQLFEPPPLVIVGERLQERPQTGAADPRHDRRRTVHDVKVFGFPEIDGRRERLQQIVVERRLMNDDGRAGAVQPLPPFVPLRDFEH